jgi:phage gp29-like protein
MSSRSVILDEEHFRVVEDKARALGTTTDAFVTKLIDAAEALDELSFDELLAPVRKGFDHLNDEELDTIFAEAKSRISGSNGQ